MSKIRFKYLFVYLFGFLFFISFAYNRIFSEKIAEKHIRKYIISRKKNPQYLKLSQDQKYWIYNDPQDYFEMIPDYDLFGYVDFAIDRTVGTPTANDINNEISK